MKKRKLRYYLGCGFLFCSVLIIIFHASCRSHLNKLTSYVVYPILLLQHYCTSSFKFYFHRPSTDYIVHQWQELQKKYDEVCAQNIELASLIDYWQEVQELVDFKKQYSGQGVLAQILTKNFSDQTHFYLVNKGSNHGICRDMVALYKNCIVGRVTQVFPCFSKIILITDKTSAISALCSSSKAVGIFQGINGELCAQLHHVSHLSVMEENDLLLSSGQGLIFPRGFALGKIKSFKKDGLFYRVDVEPMVNLRMLSHCYLVQKGLQV